MNLLDPLFFIFCDTLLLLMSYFLHGSINMFMNANIKLCTLFLKDSKVLKNNTLAIDMHGLA